MKIKILSFFLVFVICLTALLTSCSNSDDNDIFFDESNEKSDKDDNTDTTNGDTDGGNNNAIPKLAYHMTEDNYFDVQNFIIFSKDKNQTNNYDSHYTPTIGFSYVDMLEREKTIRYSEDYVFLDDFKIDGYKADKYNIDACLKEISSPSFVGIVKHNPQKEDFVKYGLVSKNSTKFGGTENHEFLSKYIVSFDFKVTYKDENYAQTIKQVIYISALTANNTYYAFTEVYEVNRDGSVGGLLYDSNMIVEVRAQSLEFLGWNRNDWISKQLVEFNIAFCANITLTSKNYSATFELDNTKSDTTESINSEYLTVYAMDSADNYKKTFSSLNAIDKNGNLWHITATDVICYSPSGNELKITTAYYDYNVMDAEVTVYGGYILCADGSKVYTSADEVRVVTEHGEEIYTRYSTNLFRQFYKTLLYSTYSNAYEMSDEQKSVVLTDTNRLLTMSITNTEGTTIYEFYKLTSSKSYVTINGKGIFCISNDRVEKLVSDAQKFFANELIDATADK